MSSEAPIAAGRSAAADGFRNRRSNIVWGCEGAGEKAADALFAELDPETAVPSSPPKLSEIQPQSTRPKDGEERAPSVAKRAGKLEAISLDMGHGYAPSARNHAPQAGICIDPYHVVQLANKKLDEVRRAYWNELRTLGDQEAAKRFKDARWSLLKAPKNLTDSSIQGAFDGPLR